MGPRGQVELHRLLARVRAPAPGLEERLSIERDAQPIVELHLQAIPAGRKLEARGGDQAKGAPSDQLTHLGVGPRCPEGGDRLADRMLEAARAPGTQVATRITLVIPREPHGLPLTVGELAARIAERRARLSGAEVPGTVLSDHDRVQVLDATPHVQEGSLRAGRGYREVLARSGQELLTLPGVRQQDSPRDVPARQPALAAFEERSRILALHPRRPVDRDVLDVEVRRHGAVEIAADPHPDRVLEDEVLVVVGQLVADDPVACGACRAVLRELALQVALFLATVQLDPVLTSGDPVLGDDEALPVRDRDRVPGDTLELVPSDDRISAEPGGDPTPSRLGEQVLEHARPVRARELEAALHRKAEVVPEEHVAVGATDTLERSPLEEIAATEDERTVAAVRRAVPDDQVVRGVMAEEQARRVVALGVDIVAVAPHREVEHVVCE